MRGIKLLIAWLGIFCSLIGAAHAGAYSFTSFDFPTGDVSGLSGIPQSCLGDERTQPFAINNAGVILGAYSFSDICMPTSGIAWSGEFTYYNGVFDPAGITFSGQTPGFPGGPDTNDFGESADTSNITCPAAPNGDFARLGAQTDVNDSGVVLVNCVSTAGSVAYTFYDGVLTPTGVVVGTDINNRGQVVGYNDRDGFGHQSCDGQQGSINVPGAACSFSWAINDLGDVVGFYGINGPGAPIFSGFLLSVSEPSTLSQLAVSILLLCFTTTRRRSRRAAV